MIEFILSMVGLAMASYAVWMSSGVTSCQRELKAMERRVIALCHEVMECQSEKQKARADIEKHNDELAKFDNWHQKIQNEFLEIDDEINDINHRLGEYRQEIQGELDKCKVEDSDLSTAVHFRFVEHDKLINECKDEINKTNHQLDVTKQELKGDLSQTDLILDEIKVQLIKYQAEQQRIQSALKENGKALTKWLGGEL